MPTGRLGVSLEGVGYEAVSQVIDNTTIVYSATTVGGALDQAGNSCIGRAVKISANDTIALCVDGDAVFGKLVKVEADLVATVQVKGFTTLPGGASATLTLGSTFIGALGASSAKGYIRVAASGTAAELIKAKGEIVNNADTTNVMVLLG